MTESENKPCPHPSFSKEYMAGMDMGDKICDQCGETFTRAEWLALKAR
jgi:hypothetical protein